MITHGELFAGISGMGLGFEQAGIQTKWRVEIDKDCQKVLRRHYPNAALFSDVRCVGADNLEPVDIISFGSPCQDLSIAGNRAGLAGNKSSLFFQAIRVVTELKPAFAIWENVPGAFPSNAGRDFAAVLRAFLQCGARDIAWRVLDAQYFGVAQQRRRVFVVADFRGESAAEILFESEGVSRDIEKGTETQQEIARDIAASLRSCSGKGFNLDDETGLTVAKTLTCRTGQSLDETHDTYIAIQGTGSSQGIHGSGYKTDGKMFTLNTVDRHGVAVPQPMAFDWQSGGDVRLNVSEKHTSALCASQTPAIYQEDLSGNIRQRSVSPTLRADASTTYSFINSPMAVRRLTPLECERLQGFPDGWTKGCSDSARYRMTGNAICVAVSRWIGQRIMQVMGQ